jgi:acetyl-CoA acyltransferase
MAQAMGATREESDSFAARSHQLACQAQKDHIFEEDIIPINVPPKFDLVDQDNGPRGDTTVERLSKLRPVFDKKFGIVTAGSASFLTDGASAVLMMSMEQAEKLKYEAKAVLKDYIYKAGDPKEEMLLGPALAIPELLNRNGLTTDDIDVWEIHEAFAAQMVCFFKAFESEDFMKKRLGFDKTFGKLPLEKMNIYGGSLSLGHPFAATGGRLMTTASRRLQKEKARYAIIAGCAAGGHGSAILLENPNL